MIRLQGSYAPKRLYGFRRPVQCPKGVRTVKMRRRIVRLGCQQPVEKHQGGRRIAASGNKRTEIVQHARRGRVQIKRRTIGTFGIPRPAGLLMHRRPFYQCLEIFGHVSQAIF